MPDSKGKSEQRLVCLIGVVLALGTLACYWQTRHFEFVDIDDQLYVYKCPMVERGLSWPGVVWAFHSVEGGNWNPLIWLSHMADSQIFGPSAGGHHVTNFLLHAINACLLFFVLREMTGAIWRSGFVAAIFAWHPLHVESVAWVSERKDVLSTLFWLLAMWAYARYAKAATAGTARKFYGVALLCFALGLMSKPMLVTFPVILLLLDYWPLQRAESPGRLLLEKIPFAVLSFIECLLAIWAQRKVGAMASPGLVPRLENAVVSYVNYIAKFFWPVKLAVFYPFPNSIPALRVVGAVLVLIAITVTVLLAGRRHRYLITGWLWFLITLLPVIGLLQVGMQAMADRYTYVPYIGLSITLAWGFVELVERSARGRELLALGTAVALAGCVAVTCTQIRYWKDSGTLYAHAVAVTSNNYFALDDLGNILRESGKVDEAIARYQEALQCKPAAGIHYNLGIPYNDLGLAYVMQNRNAEALQVFSKALQIDPTLEEARWNFGKALILKGDVPRGLAEMEASVRQRPNDIEVQSKFADVLFGQGKASNALPYCEVVARAQPNDPHALFNLGAAYLAQQRTDKAAKSFVEGVRLAPNNPKCLNALAWIYATSPQAGLRNGAEAVRLAENACGISRRQDPAILDTLAAAYAEVGRFDDATKTAQEMLALAAAFHDPATADTARQHLDLYKAGKPCRSEP